MIFLNGKGIHQLVWGHQPPGPLWLPDVLQAVRPWMSTDIAPCAMERSPPRRACWKPVVSNIPLLTSIITTLVAVIGLFVGTVFNSLVRRDSRRKQEQDAVHAASMRLAAEKPSERAGGLGIMIDYMPNKYTAESARLINRELWLDATRAFEQICVKAERQANEKQLAVNMRMLKQNEKLLAMLIQDTREVRCVDLSNTFLPGWYVPKSNWIECNFRDSLLHYSNFRGTTFSSCDMSRAVLIGSYFEGVKV